VTNTNGCGLASSLHCCCHSPLHPVAGHQMHQRTSPHHHRRCHQLMAQNPTCHSHRDHVQFVPPASHQRRHQLVVGCCHHLVAGALHPSVSGISCLPCFAIIVVLALFACDESATKFMTRFTCHGGWIFLLAPWRGIAFFSASSWEQLC